MHIISSSLRQKTRRERVPVLACAYRKDVAATETNLNVVQVIVASRKDVAATETNLNVFQVAVTSR